MQILFVMENGPFEIRPYSESGKEQIVSIWEQSVLATHHFLTPSDFHHIKEIVKSIDFNSFAVFCLVHQNKVIGFIGVAEKKVEMLFLSPQYFGKGLGKKLMQYAIKELHANEVDVNEQNRDAFAFYQKMGFETYERLEKDSLGKDYPILRMRLKEAV